MNPYTWTADRTTGRHELLRDGQWVGTLLLNHDLPFHAWIAANLCDQLWEIERANRHQLHAVAQFADTVQRRKEAAG